MTKRGTCYALARPQGLEQYRKGEMLAVDTFKDAPADMKRFERLNPFYFDPGNEIPVPGQPGLTACSIESIWQGLKIVDGNTAFEMFQKPPWKRPPDHERKNGYRYHESVFLYGKQVLNLLEARFVIYLPTYLHVLEHVADKAALTEIAEALEQGRDVCFYDWDENTDIENVEASFSHSAILAAFFNGNLQSAFLDKMNSYIAAYS